MDTFLMLSDDKRRVLDLIQTRIDSEKRICLTDARINQAWVDQVMSLDETYDETHNVFGLFVDNVLIHILILKLLDDTTFSVSYTISREGVKPRMVDGYNVYTTEILDSALQYMENNGYTTCYSIIPDHPKWKRSDQNPNRRIKGRWIPEEVEHIPAGELPKIPFHLNIASRAFNLPMVIRKMTLHK